MSPDERAIRDRRLVPAVVLALAAALVAHYWLGLRPIPEDWGCGEAEPAGNDLGAFRAGAPVIHAVCMLILLAAVVWLSQRRRGDRPGMPTMIAAGACAVVAVVAAASPEPVGEAVLLGAFYAMVLSFGVLPAAGPVLLVAGALSRRRFAPLLSAAGLWLAATVLVPGHALLVYLRGEGPIVC